MCLCAGVVTSAGVPGPDAGARAVSAGLGPGAAAELVPEAVGAAVLHRSSDASLPPPLSA